MKGAIAVVCAALMFPAAGRALAQPAPAAPAPQPVAWAAYYGTTASAAAFAPFDVVILDSSFLAPLATLRERGKTVLAYLSLGEAAPERPYFSSLRDDGLLLAENPNWPGSFAIDVRDPRWRERVVGELVPAILSAGFDGLFLDTLDTPIELERADPDAAPGMREAAADLVLAIRARFPDARLMLNRAFVILPEVGPHVDMLLGESVFTRYDFASGTYRMASPDDAARSARRLADARKDHPNLQVLTLDYWDAADPAGIRTVYALGHRLGLSPYVATIGLDRVVYEPGP